MILNSNSLHFIQVYQQFLDWMNEEVVTKNFTYMFATCGDWDLRTMMKQQLAVSRIDDAPAYFNTWINIKKAYEDITGKTEEQIQRSDIQSLIYGRYVLCDQKPLLTIRTRRFYFQYFFPCFFS